MASISRSIASFCEASQAVMAASVVMGVSRACGAQAGTGAPHREGGRYSIRPSARTVRTSRAASSV